MVKLDCAIKSEPYKRNHKNEDIRCGFSHLLFWGSSIAVIAMALQSSLPSSSPPCDHTTVQLSGALFAHLWDTGKFWVWANDCWLGLTRSPVLGNKKTRWPLPIAWCQVTKVNTSSQVIAVFCDLRALSAYKMWWHFSQSCSCSENMDIWKRGRHDRYNNESVLGSMFLAWVWTFTCSWWKGRIGPGKETIWAVTILGVVAGMVVWYSTSGERWHQCVLSLFPWSLTLRESRCLDTQSSGEAHALWASKKRLTVVFTGSLARSRGHSWVFYHTVLILTT